MFRVSEDFSPANGTSRVGEIELVYSDIVAAFGEPIESDGYKVSGEWIFVDDENGIVFTLYDWKSTDLYDQDLPSVEAFRSNPNPCWFNIGGIHQSDIEGFKSLLKRQIEWVKIGKPFEQVVLGIESPKRLLGE